METDTIPLGQFEQRAGKSVNPYLSVIIERLANSTDAFRNFICEWQNDPNPRAVATASYVSSLIERLSSAGALPPPVEIDHAVLFQAEDNPVDVRSISWERRAHWQAVDLVPDLYYYLAGGYPGYLDAGPRPWSERRSQIIWRGSTTGRINMAATALDDLDRYQLARAMKQFGDGADVRFTGLAQAASELDGKIMLHRLADERLMGDFVPMNEMSDWRFIIDIDGNSSSWNFIAKLLLGCCLLKVDSDWRQWFSDDIQPWVHYVPIAADLSDVAERVEWCFTHDDQAAAIGRRGRDFALAMDFDTEMSKASQKLAALFMDRGAWTPCT